MMHRKSRRTKMTGALFAVDRLKSKFKERNITVDVLILLFGIGCWIVVNGTFMQLPLFVRTAPEAWSLPSYLNIAVQSANIGPIIYVTLCKLFPSKINDRIYIYVLMTITSISSLLITFFYNRTVVIDGQEHSVFLYVLVFCAAFYGCSSNVVSFPYMRIFKDVYIANYFVGEGLSNFISSLLSSIQGIDQYPRCINSTDVVNQSVLFGSRAFLLTIFLITCLSLLSFYLLNNLKVCKNETVDNVLIQTDDCSSVPLIITKRTDFELCCWLVLLMVNCSFIYGIYPCIMPFSCLPYGYGAYHLTVILCGFFNPVACSMAFFFPHVSTKAIFTKIFIGSLATVYIVVVAAQNPNPLLLGTNAGIVFVISAWIIGTGVLNYVKLSIAMIFRNEGRWWMILCGAFIQIGGFTGSIIGFLLINWAKVFVQTDFCR